MSTSANDSVPARMSKCYLWCWRTHDVDEEKWKTWCKTWGKHWVFQLETGEVTGRDHFQGMISLKTKRTKSEAIACMSPLPEYFAPMLNSTIKGGSETFYVTKPETRKSGPWSDKDELHYIPRQYRGLTDRLKPWQKVIWDSADWWEDRIINVIVDDKGCQGKSTIASLMDLHGRGIDCQVTNDKEKLIQSLADVLMNKECRVPRTVLVDIPRSDRQDKLFGLYAAIEQIKKGKVTDTRYSYKEWWFDSPVVWVFCNEAPSPGYVSRDRWRFWSIVDDDLIREEPEFN